MATLTAKILADFETSLATAMAIGATTATLQSATDDDSIALPSGRYFFALDNSNSSKEHISCSLSGTSLTSIRSVSRQGVETVGVVRAHRLGATVTITDFAHILQINNLVNGTTQLDATVPLSYDGTAAITTANQITTKVYVDGIAIAGSPDSNTTTKGIGRVSVAPVSAVIPIFVGDNDPRNQRANFIDNTFADSTGAVNTFIITLPNAPSAYTNGQQFTFKAVNANTGTSTLNVNGLGAVTIRKTGGGTVLAANDILAGQIVTVQYDGTNFQMLNPLGNAPAAPVFGGTGADGVLTITSGATNINLGGVRFFVRNYTSISITGTGSLTFTNPHTNGTVIVLKSKGDVTLTSSATPMINASNTGAAGAPAVTSSTPQNGTAGSAGVSVLYTFAGGFGGINPNVANGAPTLSTNSEPFTTTRQKYSLLPMASGAGSGNVNGSSNVTATSGVGGRSGGTLAMEVAGAWNFTTTSGISVAGTNGGNGIAGSSNTSLPVAGGGGAGAGGYFLALYNILIANTGTVTVTAGVGGNCDSFGASDIRSGGNSGGSLSGANTGNGSGSANVKTGGDGAVGMSTITQNTDF